MRPFLPSQNIEHKKQQKQPVVVSKSMRMPTKVAQVQPVLVGCSYWFTPRLYTWYIIQQKSYPRRKIPGGRHHLEDWHELMQITASSPQPTETSNTGIFPVGKDTGRQTTPVELWPTRWTWWIMPWSDGLRKLADKKGRNTLVGELCIFPGVKHKSRTLQFLAIQDSPYHTPACYNVCRLWGDPALPNRMHTLQATIRLPSITVHIDVTSSVT